MAEYFVNRQAIKTEAPSLSFLSVVCNTLLLKQHGMSLDYPGKKESFDLISMNHYIEPVLNPVAELQKSFDLLKPAYIIWDIT